MNHYVTTNGCTAEMRNRYGIVLAHAAFANEEHAIAGAKAWAAEIGEPYIPREEMNALLHITRPILMHDGSPVTGMFNPAPGMRYRDTPEARLARLHAVLRRKQVARREADEAIADILAEILTLRASHGL